MKKWIMLLLAICLFSGLSSALVEEEKKTAGEWVTKVWTYQDADNQTRTLEYYLFVPNTYESGQSLPLITWIADASGVGKEKEILLKNKAPVLWTKPEKMEKHPYFFLTINFPSVAEKVEDPKSSGGQIVPIIDQVILDYGVDQNRLYLTGQSMGGILEFQINTLYPEKFAASYYVGTQPSADRTFEDDIAQYVLGEKAFLQQKFVYMVSKLNTGAYTGEVKLMEACDAAQISYTVLEGLNRKNDALDEELRETLSDGHDKYFFAYSKVSTGTEGDEHNNTWKYAYNGDAILDWLLEQSLDNQ